MYVWLTVWVLAFSPKTSYKTKEDCLNVLYAKDRIHSSKYCVQVEKLVNVAKGVGK